MWDSEEKDQWLRNKRMLSKEASRHWSWRRQEETRVCSVSVRSNRISDLRGKKLKESKKARTSQDFLCLGTWMNNDRELRRQSKYGGKVMSAKVNLSLKGLQDIPCQCRRQGLDPWVKKTPWRRKWQPTPIFLPGESHGQRSLEDYTVHRVPRSQTRLKWLSIHACMPITALYVNSQQSAIKMWKISDWII